MRAILLYLALPLVALLAVACDENGGSRDQTARGDLTTPSPTLNPTVGMSPTSPLSATPIATQAQTPTAGSPAVDAVVRAVQARDLPALVDIVRYTEMQCISQPQGIGAPPLCSAAGAPPGSTVEVLPALLCEGEFVVKPVVPGFLQSRLQSGLTFSGVFKPERHPFASPSADRTWPVPEQAVIFRSTATPGLDLGFYLREGRIIAVGSFGICGPQLPPPADPAWLVPPRP